MRIKPAYSDMKKILSAIISILSSALAVHLQAQELPVNSDPDGITGTYFVSHEGENSKVRIYAAQDGSFTAQVIWVEDRLDSDGNVRLDEKNPDKSLRTTPCDQNPDKSLRTTPCDQITIIEGLEFNPAKKRWDKGKIYDPTRGIRANVSCVFVSPDSLKVRGTLMGFGETIYWTRTRED